jgi:hypothetical protein
MDNSNFLESNGQELPRQEDNLPADLVKKEIEQMEESSRNRAHLDELAVIAADEAKSFDELRELMQGAYDYMNGVKRPPEAPKAFDDDYEEYTKNEKIVISTLFQMMGLAKIQGSFTDEEILRGLEYFKKIDAMKKNEYDNQMPEEADGETDEERKEREEDDEIYRRKLEERGELKSLETPEEVEAEIKERKILKKMDELEKDVENTGIEDGDLFNKASLLVEEDDNRLKKIKQEIKDLMGR